MVLGIITGIILLILAIVCGGWAIYEFEEHEFDANYNNRRGAIATILSIVLLISFIIVPFSFHTVDTGEVAVVKRLGKAVDVKTPGTYFDLWVTKKYAKYDGKVQDNVIETMAYSSDAQTMDIQMSLQYQVLTDKVMDIANQYGSLQTLDARITAIATEKVKSVLSSYKAMDIISKREAMSPEVEQTIINAITDEYFVNIVSVVLTNIDFSDAFETAVEDKMIAEQKKLKADYENETVLAKAEAEAQAKILQAEGEKKANELLEKSLTEKILQEMYIEKWNGQLPKVVTDGEMIMEVPDLE